MVDPLVAKAGEHLAEKAIDKAAEILFERIDDFVNRNTNNLLAAWEQDRRNWVVEWRILAERRLKELEARSEDQAAFAGALARMIEDQQFWKVLANLQWEAARESLRERRRMLGYVSAELCDPDMTVNDKARIERIMRTLDPSDIVVLRNAAKNPSLMPTLKGKNGVSYYTLVSAGCVSEGDGSFGGAPQVTPIGTAVLCTLEAYVPEEGNA